MKKAGLETLILLVKRAQTKLHTLLVSRCFYSTGQGVSVAKPLRASNLSLVQLGRRVTIHSNCWINVLRFAGDGDAPKIVMRDGVCIGMDATISAAQKIEIGENVFTARNVYISDHAHEFHDVTRPISSQGIGNIGEVSIGADTWIGQNAVILPGVTVGRHCVIAANSVVNSDVPDYSVAAGAPARVVRAYNVTSRSWDRTRNS